MTTLFQDLRYSVRMLARNPGFTAIVVLVMALGIGANAAMFTVVNSVLLRPLPYPDSDRLLVLDQSFARIPGLERVQVSGAEFRDYRQRSRSFAGIAAYRSMNFNLAGPENVQRVLGAAVTGEFFSVMGVSASSGRLLSPVEEAGSTPAVVLSQALWQREFGGRPDVVGRPVKLNGNEYVVLGVMPAGFQFPGQAELWVPINLNRDVLANRQSRSLNAIARLKPGVSLKQARAEMDLLARGFQAEYPDAYPADSGWGAGLTELREQIVGSFRQALLLLMAAVGCVLLIACANVANLLLARAAARRKELAIRAALGARTGRLIRQLLTESQLLALAGGAAGLLIAYWAHPAIRALLPGFTRVQEARLDSVVFAFTLAIAILAGILSGISPALQIRKGGFGALKEGGAAGIGQPGRRLRKSLVVVEVSLAVVLLIGAGLLLRSFQRILAVDPGFDPRDVVTLSLSLPPSAYPQKQEIGAFYHQLVSRVGSMPGVQAGGVVAGLPLGGDVTTWGFRTESPAASPSAGILSADFRIASPYYFRAMGIALRRGRFFSAQDNEASLPVAVINETAARRFWPGEDALGRRLKFGSPEPKRTWDAPWLTIVGVVGDVKFTGLDAEARPEIYTTPLQNPWRGLPPSSYMTIVGRGMTLAVRSTAETAAVVDSVRTVLRELDPALPVFNVQTMRARVGGSLASPRFRAALLGAFAALALLLAVLGVYGVMSFLVSQRTHEIGVRMALGAEPAHVLRMVLAQAASLTAIGVVLGTAAALGLTRFIARFLFGIGAHDPLTFLAIPAVLALAALLAGYFPARRATKVDPMVALRYE